jgi:hypothetical protein
LSRYLNTITGESCDAEPPEFRGGLLADSMGLGKSLSTISLIAANPAGVGEVSTMSLDIAAVKTTLLVVPSTCKSRTH